MSIKKEHSVIFGGMIAVVVLSAFIVVAHMGGPLL